MSDSQTKKTTGRIVAQVTRLGGAINASLEYVGGMAYMALDTLVWCGRAWFRKGVRFGREALYGQIVRIGVRSIFIIALLCACIGMILTLQMAPPLEDFGQKDVVANIVGVAVLRELGPLISAIVLTGFAGASIAAEIGTMVVGEEIEALESMALNPVRFLVLPRVLASVISLTLLCVFGDVIAILASAGASWLILDVPLGVFESNLLGQVKLSDFLTGVGKAAIFGFLIGLISCYNGLRVSGGAAGVGHATTLTVVHSIVSIIVADMIFTAIFYILGWA